MTFGKFHRKSQQMQNTDVLQPTRTQKNNSDPTRSIPGGNGGTVRSSILLGRWKVKRNATFFFSKLRERAKGTSTEEPWRNTYIIHQRERKSKCQDIVQRETIGCSLFSCYLSPFWGAEGGGVFVVFLFLPKKT